MFRKFAFSLLSLLVIASHYLSAEVVSLESNFVAGQADITTKLNADRLALTNGVNNIRGVSAGSVQTAGQIKGDTVGEENMADDANPRIRTAESASCPDVVYSGLLPTTSASLTGSIPAGVAYPDGYRVEKTSATSKVFTASMWTFVYITTSGSFSYNEVAIGAATPSAAANSATLARVSTDGTTIVSVQDLRTTSCTNGPFSNIGTSSGEPNLDDIFRRGTPVRRFSPAGRSPEGFAQGAIASWDTHTTFKVTAGSLYINGEYRAASTDITVPTTADDPTQGTSGIDTGAIAASTAYFIYAVADQDAVKPFSVSFSTSATAPSGITNYRKIGRIRTDGNSLFTSQDIVTAHAVSEREIINGWVHFDGTASTIVRNDGLNVTSSIADNGTGSYAITWDEDYNNTTYAAPCTASTNDGAICNTQTFNTGTLVIKTFSHGGVAQDERVTLISTGDFRR